MTAIDVLDGTEPKPDIRPEVIPTYRPPPGLPVPRDPRRGLATTRRPVNPLLGHRNQVRSLGLSG